MGLTLLSFTDPDFTAGDKTDIKCVHGLTIFQHNIVGDVDDIIDWTDAQGAQAFAYQRGGRGLDADIFDNRAG